MALTTGLLDVLLEAAAAADILPNPAISPGVQRELTSQMIQELSRVLIETDPARRRSSLIVVTAMAATLAHSCVPDPEPGRAPV